ncbi:DUF4352 domain-containing protein [Spinactinospora alkalitolerans]|uniref:DUF4352 domain-containing protein n=1 Tax=Spinactinospora alkalitolerans TaxID=687207 RepID=UPI003CD0A3F6
MNGTERVTTISSDYGTNAVAPDGQDYLLVEVTFANASQAPQSVDPESAMVVDDTGSMYGMDYEALMTADSEDALYSEVNPGGSVDMRVPFLVGEDTRITQAHMTGVWDGGQFVVVDFDEAV